MEGEEKEKGTREGEESKWRGGKGKGNKGGGGKGKGNKGGGGEQVEGRKRKREQGRGRRASGGEEKEREQGRGRRASGGEEKEKGTRCHSLCVRQRHTYICTLEIRLYFSHSYPFRPPFGPPSTIITTFPFPTGFNKGGTWSRGFPCPPACRVESRGAPEGGVNGNGGGREERAHTERDTLSKT